MDAIPTLAGRRVLLVEDESLVLIHLENMLLDLGAASVVCAMRLAEAVAMAETVAVDVVILDVNLSGEHSYPVAQVLRRRGIPILFVTGYGDRIHDAAWAGTPTLAKPVHPAKLGSALSAILAG